MKRLTSRAEARLVIPHSPCTAERGRSGFTLLEALIVALLFAVTAGWVASSASFWADDTRLLMAGRRLVADLRAARQTAVLHTAPCGVVPDVTGDAYVVSRPGSSPRAVSLGSGVALSGGPIWFHPRGNAAPAGSLSLRGSRHAVRVIVSVSGRVRWEVRP